MNQLQFETSPYLLQHKDNPVHWFPWGAEALALAKEQDKPIFLSIGYSACHWCHVMAHESFEDQETADIMNTHFINIKVDREERPDIDTIYMQAVQAMTRSGGWPLTVFLTPDAKPFYGGTYFPLEPRYGMPSFKQVLLAVFDAYRDKREAIEEQSHQLAQALNRDIIGLESIQTLDASLLDSAAEKLYQQFDQINGGFGTQPKFPNPSNYEFLLRHYYSTGNPQSLHVVTYSLKKMAEGGIYDQIGGGFSRYSVDSFWLIPHFEKMLYDNAQLSRLYLHAYQVTGDEFFKSIAVDIFDYILREMTAPEGGFYSATDADSEGEEGKYFVWDKSEIEASLAQIEDEVPDAARLAIAYWGVTDTGNFEGKNILHIATQPEDVAADFGLSLEEFQRRITLIKDRLYADRTSRVNPGLDDKSLTAWNSLMLASLAEAARVLGRDDYLAAAERAGDFILENMLSEEGRLFRTFKQGTAKLNAYLIDYATTIDAFLELYQSTFLEKWFLAALKLTDFALSHFSSQDVGFFDTSDDHETLLIRPRELQDNAIPAANNILAKQLLRLFAYTANNTYYETAATYLQNIAIAAGEYPSAFSEALSAIHLLQFPLTEVAIIANPAQTETKQLLQRIYAAFLPSTILALSRRDQDESARIPLLQNRKMLDSKATFYICHNFVCNLPLTDPDAVLKQLQIHQ
ncbi:thioredoxin domain-containing protein [Anaerolineales bacterium]